MTQYIILCGNPVDGYDLYGPFDNDIDALRYADNNCDYGEGWTIAKLIKPEGE